MLSICCVVVGKELKELVWLIISGDWVAELRLIKGELDWDITPTGGIDILDVGSTSKDGGKLLGIGTPVSTFLIRKQAILNSRLSSLPSLFKSDRFLSNFY